MGAAAHGATQISSLAGWAAAFATGLVANAYAVTACRRVPVR